MTAAPVLRLVGNEDEATEPPITDRDGGGRRRAGPTTSRLAVDYSGERRKLGVTNRESSSNTTSVLTRFCEMAPVDPSKITRRTIIRWANGINHLAPNTRRGYFTILRGFVRWLQYHGHVKSDPFRDVPLPRAVRPLHRALTPDQVGELVGACEDQRDLVVLFLGLHAGLRRAELAALEVGDVSLAGRTITVRKGKGGHSRVVPLAAEAAKIVGAYMAQAGMTSGPLLRDQRTARRGITGQTVGRIFERLATRSGVKVRARDGVGTHSLRHTCASDVYAACRDVLAVRDLLGHVELGTTQRYVQGLDLTRLREVVEGRTYLPQVDGADGVVFT